MYNDELEKIQPMIKHEMENAFKLEVPLVVDLGMGKIGWKRIRIKQSQIKKSTLILNKLEWIFYTNGTINFLLILFLSRWY
jgi:signal recognition particle GTPase